MGFFKRKARKPKQPSVNDTTDVPEEVFSEQYRAELRQLGREHFIDLVDAGAVDLRRDVDEMMQQVASDLKAYMTKQLDITAARINTELTNQLNDQVRHHNQIASDAQTLATQSLSRNAQALHEKYQQMSTSLQEVVAQQEVQMLTVFQDSKARVSAMQSEQDQLLQTLSESAKSVKQQSDHINQVLRQNASAQATRLNTIYQENIERVTVTRDTQAAAIDKLERTSQALEGQYQQLHQLLDKSIADQKAMVTELINDNMAQIVEHYLVGALGEQSDVRAQLPSIIEHMEENKQAMAEDMRL